MHQVVSLPQSMDTEHCFNDRPENYLTQGLPRSGEKSRRELSYSDFESDVDVRASMKLDEIISGQSKVLDPQAKEALKRRRISHQMSSGRQPPKPGSL